VQRLSCTVPHAGCGACGFCTNSVWSPFFFAPPGCLWLPGCFFLIGGGFGGVAVRAWWGAPVWSLPGFLAFFWVGSRSLLGARPSLGLNGPWGCEVFAGLLLSRSSFCFCVCCVFGVVRGGLLSAAVGALWCSTVSPGFRFPVCGLSPGWFLWPFLLLLICRRLRVRWCRGVSGFFCVLVVSLVRGEGGGHFGFLCRLFVRYFRRGLPFWFLVSSCLVGVFVLWLRSQVWYFDVPRVLVGVWLGRV